jgi:hypothetical protein
MQRLHAPAPCRLLLRPRSEPTGRQAMEVGTTNSSLRLACIDLSFVCHHQEGCLRVPRRSALQALREEIAAERAAERAAVAADAEAAGRRFAEALDAARSEAARQLEEALSARPDANQLHEVLLIGPRVPVSVSSMMTTCSDTHPCHLRFGC